MKFSKETVYFKTYNTPIIGNFTNGVVIGLDSIGESLINRIYNGEEILENNLSPDELILFNELKSSSFFSDSNQRNIDSAYLHITSHCNLKCKGCYSLEDERNKKVDLSFEEICSILKNLKIAGMKNLVLSGGEVFLRKDIKEILSFAKNNLKIENILAITNGTLDLNTYKSCQGLIDVLAVSIDGYNENISFIRDEGIMKGVLNVAVELKEYFNLQFIATLHRKNLSFIDEYLKLSNKLQIPITFSLFTVNKENLESKDFILHDEDYIYLANLVEKNNDIYIEDSPLSGELGCRNSCGAGKELLSIASNGDVFPCHMFHDEKFKMGNALKDNILDILYKNLEVNGTISNMSVDLINSCSKCDNKYLCGGGCRFRAYAYENDIYGKDPACIGYLTQYKKIFKELENI